MRKENFSYQGQGESLIVFECGAVDSNDCSGVVFEGSGEAVRSCSGAAFRLIAVIGGEASYGLLSSHVVTLLERRETRLRFALERDAG